MQKGGKAKKKGFFGKLGKTLGNIGKGIADMALTPLGGGNLIKDSWFDKVPVISDVAGFVGDKALGMFDLTTNTITIGDIGVKPTIKKIIGVPEYMPLEMYKRRFTPAIDVYAIGMCVLYMQTGSRPYQECKNAEEIYNKVKNNIPPNNIHLPRTPDSKNFIDLCLASQPNMRPSVQELLNHNFLQDN